MQSKLKSVDTISSFFMLKPLVTQGGVSRRGASTLVEPFVMNLSLAKKPLF